MKLEWLSEIERRVGAETPPVSVSYAREDVLKLCRAVRELYSALELAFAYLPDSLLVRVGDHLVDVLERWERGGDQEAELV